MEPFPPIGVYDTLLTESLKAAIEALPKRYHANVESLDAASLAEYLGSHVGEVVSRYFLKELRRLEESDEESDMGQNSARGLIEAANRILVELENKDRVFSSRLSAVFKAVESPPKSPIIPLSVSSLVTNSRDLNFHALLKSELETADEVDFICPFIGMQGVRLIIDSLGKVQGNKRIITTTYLGVSEAKAVDALVNCGAEVKVIYESSMQKTSLHAKSWIFHRNSEFTTATVGSSNLSHRALVDGLEWNVRLGAKDSPHLIEELKIVFQKLWEDSSSQSYNPKDDRERLSTSLAQQSGSDDSSITIFFDIVPHPHQVEALENLSFARSNERNKNLIVAATGTGKTLLSAFDYQNLAKKAGKYPTLLYIAHREDILKQSLAAYRQVLRDSNFGELHSGSSKPAHWKQVFSTIQSLHSFDLSQFDRNSFDIIIIDEFHHSEASSYRKVLDAFDPLQCLGLTATPERMDGKNELLQEFWPPTFELRLWHALDRQLLCPFHYFGIDDETDLSDIKWDAGKYQASELDQKYIESGSQRVQIILREINDKCSLNSMHAVAFCNSIRHCNYMANALEVHGLSAESLTSGTPREERERLIRQFREGRIKVLCTVDLFNEGIDIPQIDTVLFLRPTESSTVFIQQLGRGLRLSEDKGVLTVLDFVGRQNTKFRMDKRFCAMTGLTRTELKEAVKKGFPRLPPGCNIQLDRITSRQVLEAIKNSVPTGLTGLADEVRRFVAVNGRIPNLNEFLQSSSVEVEDVYRGDRCYTEIIKAAGFWDGKVPEDMKRIGKLKNACDPVRNQGYRTAIETNLGQSPDGLSSMLSSPIFQGKNRARELSSPFVEEALQLADIVCDAQTPYKALSKDLPFSNWALYTRDEIVGMFRTNPTSMRQGTFFVESLGIDIHLVTLVKSEKQFSPSTMYQDYFESNSIFHWDSQVQTSLASKAGQRLIDPGSRAVLFVRAHKEVGRDAQPFLCLGNAKPIGHERDNPIHIRYKLENPVPDHVYQELSRITI